MKSAKGYYRVMLGQKSVYAAECFAGNFIGTDFGIDQDLTKKLPEGVASLQSGVHSYLPGEAPGQNENRRGLGVRSFVDRLKRDQKGRHRALPGRVWTLSCWRSQR